MSKQFDLAKVENAYKTILSALPLTEECVDDTPNRAARALFELTQGYRVKIEDVVGKGIFPHKGEGIVCVKNIEISSLCEHHLLPFIGTCTIAYIPDKVILGLSKLKRIADVYSRRLQVQERLTEQIADAIEKFTKPKGVIVIIRSSHLCMKIRGVCESDTETSTVSTRGEFKKNEHLQSQYFNDSITRPKI